MTHWGRKKEGAEIVNAGFTGICLSPCREWGLRMARRLGDALLIVGLAAPACAAGGYATDWAKAAKSEARLVAADGRLAGFEVALAPGAITYWRDPGDAGLPPAFDFSGSENVLRVEPVFPAPKRIREADGSEAFGYDGSVLFPLRVEKRDPSKPATLALHANYAVCEKVCLPAEARLTLALPAAGDASPYAGLVETALAAAPHVVAAKDFGELKSDGAGRLAALRRARIRRTARPLRRTADRLVGDSRARSGRGGARLLQPDAARQAERRRAAGRPAPDADGRRGAGRDDDGGRRAEVGPATSGAGPACCRAC